MKGKKKSYYQYKGSVGLDHHTFHYLAWKARRYPFLLENIKRIEAKNPLNITEKDMVNKAAMEKEVALFEEALIKYVPENYRAPVKEHCLFGKMYEELENKYFFSESSIRRAAQTYIWGVAQELGEDYKN